MALNFVIAYRCLKVLFLYTFMQIFSTTNADYHQALINYQCMGDQVLIVHSKTADYIKMHCGKPSICGENRKCSMSNVQTGVCKSKANYLQGVFENDDRSVDANCCNYVPPVEYHITDRCTAQEIYDKPRPTVSTTVESEASPTSSNAPSSTPKSGNNDSYIIVNDSNSPNGQSSTTTQVAAAVTKPLLIVNDVNLQNLNPQRKLDPRLFAALTDYMKKQEPNFKWADILINNNNLRKVLKKRSIEFGNQKPFFLGNIDSYVSSSSYGNVDMRLYKLTDVQKPVELVKGIEKITNGYRITSCLVICSQRPNDTTSSNTSTTTSNTSRPPKKRCKTTTSSSTSTSTTSGTSTTYDTSTASTQTPSTESTTMNLNDVTDDSHHGCHAASTTSTSTQTSTSTTTTSSSTTGGCRLISGDAASKMRELLKIGKLLHQTPIPGYKEVGRYCKGPINKGCLEKCLQILETRFKNAHCEAGTSNCICDQDQNSSNFEDNIKIHHFDPYNQNCYTEENITTKQADPIDRTPTTQPSMHDNPTTKGSTRHPKPNNKTVTPINDRYTTTYPPYIPGGGCFSAEGLVVTKQHGPTKMRDLKVGHEVKTLSADDGSVSFEPVEWFYHRDINQKAKFLQIITENGHTLILTENHLLPTFDCRHTARVIRRSIDHFTDSYSKFASKAKTGDCLLSLSKYRYNQISDNNDQNRSSLSENGNNNDFLSIDRIIDIKRGVEMTGIFSPITRSGSILVDNVHASCYSTVENQMLQRSLHNFFINLHHVIKNLYGYLTMALVDPFNSGSIMASEENFDREIPVTLHYMLKVAKYVMPFSVS